MIWSGLRPDFSIVQLHLFLRKSSSCMNDFNAGAKFIKYKFYQVSANKLS